VALPDHKTSDHGHGTAGVKNRVIGYLYREARSMELGVRPVVTLRRLVTGLIIGRGVCKADQKSILGLFPEHAS
jgi:hypothetical protein